MAETTNMRFFLRRCFDKLQWKRSVLSPGPIMARGSERWIVLTDALYDLLDAAPSVFDPGDTRTQTAPASPPLVATSDAVSNANDGLLNVIWDVRGTSLVNGVAGSSTFTELQNPLNRYWAQLLAQGGNPYILQEDADPFAPDFIRMAAWWQKKSCLIRNWGRDGQRMWSKPGVSYQNGEAWLDHYQAAGGSIYFLGQEHNVFLDFGTNDVTHAMQAGYTLYGDPSKGRPNLIEDCLIPTMAAERSLDPNVNIYVGTPIARGFASLQPQNNQTFIDYGDWLLPRVSTLGIKKLVDRRNYPEFDPRQFATSAYDTTFFQPDRVHLTATGYAKLANYDRFELDIP
ncbi:MAG: hypothetical protein PGN22_05760 [Agrobacterium cavarae]